jgi:hypothetical protein
VRILRSSVAQKTSHLGVYISAYMRYASGMKIINPQVRLQQVIKRHKTQRATAVALDLGESYVSDLLSGRRAPSEAVLAKLKLRRIIVNVSRADTAS